MFWREAADLWEFLTGLHSRLTLTVDDNWGNMLPMPRRASGHENPTRRDADFTRRIPGLCRMAKDQEATARCNNCGRLARWHRRIYDLSRKRKESGKGKRGDADQAGAYQRIGADGMET